MKLHSLNYVCVFRITAADLTVQYTWLECNSCVQQKRWISEGSSTCPCI